MANFTEQQSQNMSSEGDFTLYPYQEQSYIPTTTYAEQSYLTIPSFEPYKTQQDHDPLQEQFYFVGNRALDRSKSHLQIAGSSYSPAHSVAQSFDYQYPAHISSVSDSGASVQSTISSAMASPSMQHQNDWNRQEYPSIVQHDGMYAQSFDNNNAEVPTSEKGCVDPSLIQPYSPAQYIGNHFQDINGMTSTQNLLYAATASPEPSRTSITSPRQPYIKTQRSESPYMDQRSPQQYPQYGRGRRPSISSIHSKHSHHSHSSDESNKGMCPIPTCGRNVKDLKAHMLTHQNERPEKCSVVSCEYHIKGFARKYDKNRHTLTHYKGTMVCGFCPGSGSAAEKSFNRADVFKRHLTSVHGVEQNNPNGRKKSPSAASKKVVEVSHDATGMCSTCSKTFANAQDFYEHLDDCVLRVVQRADPTEAINEKLLSSIIDDEQVLYTLERNMFPNNLNFSASSSYAGDEVDEGEDMGEEDDSNDSTYGARSSRPGRPALKSRTSAKSTSSHISSHGSVCKPARKGLTLSKSGVSLVAPDATTKGGPKRPKDYPLSWGAAPDKMKMRKRVLCVYDGQRRLWKDDMMLNADHEVRISLPTDSDGRQPWVTDLDMQTLRRAEGLHNATEEEKGPWVEDAELERLMM